ncbi:mucin-5AC [Nycticebus coucang]|uniref:mucin-5AC n=1 Tax=Nycticebus coucang TaxID=9470 RepID=UPI00234CE606|nr:mucin-5AC [Nycticebus coucang]
MGVSRRGLAPLWALALALACAQHTGHNQDISPSYEHHPDLPPVPQGPNSKLLRGVTILPPLRTIPVVRVLHGAHNGRVCSTWGNFHYKTFDGDVFRFPGLCNYVFSAHCGAAYEDFNVQVRRGQEPNATTPSRVIMKLDGMVVELSKTSVLVNSRLVQLPFSQSGVLIQHSGSHLRVVARVGLVFMWNQDNSLLLELDSKYANQTCGLCGDFNGSPKVHEFLSHNTRLTPLEFGNLQKMDGPTELCQDPNPEPPMNCSIDIGICEEVLGSQLLMSCVALVDITRYLEACRQDLCLCEHTDPLSCACHTLAEYSRQCAHAGGLPQDWRAPHLCPQTCLHDMQYHECRSPCADTCSYMEHSQACEDHCIAGCFCPDGMVFDDIGQTGCIPASQCACKYNGATYAPGAVYTTDCTNCTCSGGRWSCREVPCPGTCSVLGGAHFSTFDEKQYTVHGDCSYVLAKPCGDSTFTVLAELRRCGLTDSETCLRSVTLSLGGAQTVVEVKASGEVFVNQIYTQLPVSTANVTLFRPSTFFIIAQTNLGLQVDIQLVPTMQVFVRLAPELQGLTCGLCGNFNQNQADDFTALSGVVEGTAVAFANTWKTRAACPNVRSSLEDPCSLSVENEKYAQHWCSLLTDTHGPFAPCHAAVNPHTFYLHCMFDTCNCEKSEDCLCAALSSYVRACAARGLLLHGWRDGVCKKPTTTCPKSMTYRYNISTCQPTCRALSEGGVTCRVPFVPVDGCTCPESTVLDDTGVCVPATSCPCYHRGAVVPNGESVHDGGAICTCTQGMLSCLGGPAPTPVCTAPMVYFDCHNATPGVAGAGCQKSCYTLDMACYSSQCVPGCVCPDGLVADSEGGCIAVEDCPCTHNEASYQAGQTIRVGCNTCTCDRRMWQCTDDPCMATCAVYGDGHYLTFDGQRYSFSGDCQYTLVQDNCGGSSGTQDAFRVVTENVPCGTTGTTCSKAIRLFLGSYELRLSDGKAEVIGEGAGQELPFTISQMGVFLVVDTNVGLELLWDRRTSIFIRLSPEFKGRVCGLCGNFDDSAINDFTTRSQSVVGNALEFGNSWKLSPSCPDALAPKDPCTTNPYRKSWAQKQCSIINSATFAACRAHVEPDKYYEACVSDACACDSGGDCECFCTAVAAYAQACRDSGVCVSWRSPDVCPLFCDYYNSKGQCEWHYQPCGAPCMRTCRNPRGDCLPDAHGLEGCYPKCPVEAPIFDEDKMQCVATCPAPPQPPPCRVHGKLYQPGAAVPSDKNCHSCICSRTGVRCTYDAQACVCTYGGQHFHPGDVIYHTTDGAGGCMSAHCGANGTIQRRVHRCGPSTPAPQTTFSFSMSPLVLSSTPTLGPRPSLSPTLSTAHASPPSSAQSTVTGTSPRMVASSASALPHLPCGEECLWSPWMDVSHPGQGVDSGDFDTLENLRAHGYKVCLAPREVECRAEDTPQVPLHLLGQRVECNPTVGLICYNKDQAVGLCDNYQIRVLCCTPLACPTSGGPAYTTPLTISRTPETQGTLSTAGTMSTTVRTTPGPDTNTPVQTTLLTPTLTSGPMASTIPSVSPTALGTSGLTEKPPGPETSPVSCLQEVCSWTAWIDGSYPGPERNSGDFDTFQNLREKGYRFCEIPSRVECRAESFPNTPLAELGQDVTCNTREGLLCLNKNQLPPICYNYQIRIQCCEVLDRCRGKPTAATQPTTGETGIHTWATVTTITSSASTEHKTGSSAAVPTATGAMHTTYTVTGRQTPDCQPRCSWTKWFDVDLPAPGPHGGDVETYSNIIRRGEKICHQPEEITKLECRAENHPDVSIEQLGQVVRCDRDVGLVCRNQDQAGRLRMCLNYEVRVLCCRTPAGCPQTTMPGPVPSTSSEGLTSPTQITSTGEKTSTTSVVTSSTTSSPQTRTTSISGVKTTSGHTASTTSGHTASTTSGHTASTTSVHTGSTTSSPQTRTTSISGVKTTSGHTASTTSSHTASTTSGHTASTTSGHTASTISSSTVKTTSSHTASTSSGQTPSSTSSPITSTTSGPITTPRPVVTTSTTFVPTPATVHTPAPGTTFSPPVNTDCQPRCSWTKWFDVDLPAPGPHGGDVETYSNIIRRGEKICHQPEEITKLECRAENHPDVSIEQLGQVVRCDRDVGLVCRNQDQAGRLRMCLNYEVRVLCCRMPAGCPQTTIRPLGTQPTTVTHPPTTLMKTSSSVWSTSVVSTSEVSSSSVPSTRTCFCSLAGQLYPAGSIIYRQTDLAGHCYYALCNQDCQVVRGVDHTCPSTTLPPAPVTSPLTSTSKPVTTQGCPSAVPPRKKGEIWALPNCSQATCEGNNVISLHPRTCPRVEEPTCANGYPALKVADQDGCCQHYQCQCVCSGWGDPHYITFDGTYYTFLDNCTYVLVQQIVPVHGHFRVLIDNYFCNAEDGLSCPQSIIVEYQQDRVVLTRRPVSGVMTNEIIFNGEVVHPGFQKNGIMVSQVGIKMYLTIPKLGVQVMFSGLIFSVEVPFSKFANNTEGQCGTCTNDQKDDCRMPGGAVAASCSVMSGLWNVTNSDQPSCHGPRLSPTTVGPTTVGPMTPPPACLPSPICQLILSEVFQLCHTMIPPWPFYEGCIFDQCHMPGTEVVCSGLELYASLCASYGVCIDWRGWTNHTCPFTCPADKVYQPCGPTNLSYCHGNDSASLMVLQEAGPITEGCFCPHGMMLFSASTQVCVPTGCPRCLGPNGEPMEPGQTVSVDCQECTCDGATWTMTCWTKPCPPPPTCPLPGFVPVPLAPQAGQCCPQYSCACNTSHCPKPVDCPQGSRPILTHEKGACCPSQNCSWTVCNVNGTLYQPGAVVSSNLCETCWCEVAGSPEAGTPVVSCETQICNTHCPVGFEYQARSGQCCGTCVQVACVTNTSGTTAHLFYPGETWSDPGSRCVTHECEKHQDGLEVVTTRKVCPPISCTLAQAKLNEDGCCLFCPPPQPQNKSSCAVYHKYQVIRQRDCSSAQPVRLAYCQGNCGNTGSMYSLEAQALQHRCACCRELRVSRRSVTLYCADGSRRAFSYTEVEQCGCVGQHCSSPGDISHSEEPEPEQSEEDHNQETEGSGQAGVQAFRAHTLAPPAS